MELFPAGSQNLAPEVDPIFIGDVATNAITTDELRVFFVHFRPGARTAWHTHSSDQVLIITEGRGIVATADRQIEVQRGDVVVAPAGEAHWHGATKTSTMTHIAVLGPGTEVVHEE